MPEEQKMFWSQYCFRWTLLLPWKTCSGFHDP